MVPGHETVRSATRQAWDALRAEGTEPSVRKLYRHIGGKYPRLVAECRVLRAEDNGMNDTVPHETDEAPPVQRKVYTCTRWPRLSIRHIRFREGRYETEDLEEQRLIETAHGYGVHIREAQG